EMLAWTSTGGRATDVTIQDGRYCKITDKTRLYLGTFFPTTTTTTEDSVARRFLRNAYNRVARSLKRTEPTGQWNGTASSWGAWNGSTANRVEVVIGLNAEPVDVLFMASATSSTGSSALIGIGLDSTSAPVTFIPYLGGSGYAYFQSATTAFREYTQI